MASQECCKGAVHKGTPVGRVETLHDLPTYISDPPNGAEARAIVVILPDAFGWEFTNTRLLADRYAQRLQMRVLVPEFMDGGAMSADYLQPLEVFANPRLSIFSRIIPGFKSIVGLMGFRRRTSPDVVMPRVTTFLSTLRSANPNLAIGASGFCWGGYYVFHLAANEPHAQSETHPTLIDAGYTAHPSNLALPTDAEKVIQPVSVAIGTLDVVCGPDGGEKIKKEFVKKGGEEKGYEVSFVKDGMHGFGVRANVEDEEQAEHTKMSDDQAIAFFERWLLKGKK